jgi:hypothetical protein
LDRQFQIHQTKRDFEHAHLTMGACKALKAKNSSASFYVSFFGWICG